MKTNLIFVAIVATTLLTLGGCQKNDTVTNPQSNQPPAYVLDTTLAIYPLAVGNGMSFRSLTLSSSGGITATVRYGPFLVTKDSVVGSQHWYFDAGWNGWLWNGPGGLWCKFPLLAPGFDTTSNLVFKWPCKVGDAYNTRYDGFDVQATVTAIDQIVTVPAIAETCVVYEYRHGGNLIEKDFLAPGIGLLRTDQYFTYSTMQTWGTALLPITTYPHYRFETTAYTQN